MFKHHCFPKSIILQAVYFKLSFSLSYRDVEELMEIRGVKVDHATFQRWVFKFTPMLDKEFRKRKKRVINIDKSGSNSSAIRVYNKRALATKSRIRIRKCKYLNNIVEQDHRFIKWRIQQGLGFKEFESARRTLSGIEIVRMIKKNQLIGQDKTVFKSFMSLAA